MKKLFIITTLALMTTTVSFSQDKIVYRNGEELLVNITKSTPDIIEFNYLNESLINQEYKNTLLKIVYESGREELCNSETNLAVIKGKKDWKKVQLTTNPDDVRGLTKTGNIKGSSGWGGTMAKSMGNSGARKNLQKKAAKMGASIVLIQDKSSGMSSNVYGVAYK